MGAWALELVGGVSTAPRAPLVLQVDLEWLGDAGRRSLFSTSILLDNPDGGRKKLLDWSSSLGAVPSGCGDLLRLRLSASGGDAGMLSDLFPVLSRP